MKRQNPVFREMTPLLEERYGRERTRQVLDCARERFARLCEENAGESKAVKAHTVADIYPCISLYEGLQQAGVEKEEAVRFLDESWSKRAEPKAASMRAMLKIPGLYKLMPAIFKWVTLHQFGADAGFAATFYPVGKRRVKFDMTRCLYCDVCRRLGCPELVPCFCHTDDVTDGNMHPQLLWNRTKIMGDGADVCDFDLIVTEKPLGRK